MNATARTAITQRSAPLALSIAAAFFAAGCMVGPDYKQPETKTADSFSSLADPVEGELEISVARGDAPLAPGAIANWWDVFGDPTLNTLVTRAVEENHDLRIAAARVREARALRGVAKADLYPTVDGSGSATRTRNSETLNRGFSAPVYDNLFEVGLDATWEIDVFGGVRREIQAADAELDAAVEDARDVLVTLAAEVARNYVEYRQFQQRIAVVERTIGAQQETVDLTDSRFQAGLSAELEVAQARAQLQLRASQLPTLVIGMKESMHRLGVLLGKEPAALAAELAELEQIPSPPEVIPVGLPSELLRRRPDIRRTERELAAATARIGVETAELFPKFSLTGSFGFRSSTFEDTLDANSRAWSFGPAFRWRIFNAGEVRNQIRAAGAREEAAVARYEQRVLVAFEEVENALTGFTQQQNRRLALARAVEANQRAVQLATDRYTSGVGDFLNVLESQRQLYDAEDQLVESEAAVTRSVIALYKALGGGWDDRRVEPDAEAPVAAEPTPEQPTEG